MKLTIIYLLLALVNLAFAVKESSNKARLSKRVLKEGLEKNSEHIQKRGGTGGRCPFIYCAENGGDEAP